MHPMMPQQQQQQAPSRLDDAFASVLPGDVTFTGKEPMPPPPPQQHQPAQIPAPYMQQPAQMPFMPQPQPHQQPHAPTQMPYMSQQPPMSMQQPIPIAIPPAQAAAPAPVPTLVAAAAPPPPPPPFVPPMRNLLRFMRAVDATAQQTPSSAPDTAVRAAFDGLWRAQSAPATSAEVQQDLQTLFTRTGPSAAARLARVTDALEPQTREYFHSQIHALSEALRESSMDLGEAAALLRWLSKSALPALQHQPEDKRFFTTAEVGRAYGELNAACDIARPCEEDPRLLAAHGAAQKRITALRSKLASMGVTDTRAIEDGTAAAGSAVGDAGRAKAAGYAAAAPGSSKMPTVTIVLIVVIVVLVAAGIACAIVYAVRKKKAGGGSGPGGPGGNGLGGAGVPIPSFGAVSRAYGNGMSNYDYGLQTAAPSPSMVSRMSGDAGNLDAWGFPRGPT